MSKWHGHAIFCIVDEMKDFEVIETITIEAPADQVHAQFGDVAHHAETGLHKGVSFEVLADDGNICRYRQTTAVGPLRLNQELELTRSADGSLENRVVSGQFAGGMIEFTISPQGEAASSVEARVSAVLRAHEIVVAPLLRRTVRRSLARALREDRDDIESGRYR